MKNSIIKKVFPALLSIFVILFIWFLCSNKINSSLILPKPILVFQRIVFYIKSKSFWINFGNTFLRCLFSLFFTIIIGTLIGIFSGLNQFVKNFFEFPLSVIRSTPVIAVILIALYWFNSSFIPVFVSVLMTLPIVVTGIEKGLNNPDKKLLEMAHLYNFSNFQIFKYLRIPSAVPYFINSLLSSFGITWKVVVAGEVLCIPKQGIGTLLQKNQAVLETTDVLAITILLVTLCFVIEKFFKFIFSFFQFNRM